MGFGKHKHKWTPIGNPLLDHDREGKIVILQVEYCKKCGMQQYSKVPSNTMRKQLEKED